MAVSLGVDINDIPVPSREPKELAGAVSLWLPEEYKQADYNRKKGVITAYLTVYNDLTGQPFVDSYLDVIEPGSFSKTISDLNSSANKKSNPWLCADLWQHDRKEPIGGIKALSEDSKGVIYEAQLVLSIPRAAQAFDLAENKMIGSSFGYDAIRFEHKGDIRHLIEIRLHEVSQVTFPANPLAPILDTKDQKKIYVPELPGGFKKFPEIPGEQEFVEEQFELEAVVSYVKAATGNTGLPIGPRNDSWDAGKARSQYKAWGTDGDGNPIPSKYNQVHLQVDGDPKLLGSYGYPFADIVNGSPQINVAGVIAAGNALSGARGADPGGDKAAMLAKVNTMRSRITKKYPDDPPLDPLKYAGIEIDFKQDFASAWASKLPAQLLNTYFRMNDTLAYTMLQNFNDDSIDDQDGMVDTMLGQYGDALKDWLSSYSDACDAMDGMDGDGGDGDGNGNGMMPMNSMLSFMAADQAEIYLNLALKEAKAGRTLSDASRSKLRTIAENITKYLGELTKFIDNDANGGDQAPAPDDTGKTQPSSDEYSITRGLDILGTLTQGNRKISVPSTPLNGNASYAPMFPSVPGEYEPEVDITDLLASIRQSMSAGGT